MPDIDDLKVYALRLLSDARWRIDQIIVNRAEFAGEAAAADLAELLFDAIGSLSRLPHRCRQIDDSERRAFKPHPDGRRREIRHLIEPKTRQWRILFEIEEDDETRVRLEDSTGALDAPMVQIIYVRPTGARPMRRKEATEIDASRESG